MTDGQRLTRRQVIVAATGGAALLAGGAGAILPGRLRAPSARAAAACVLTGARTEGPYFVDERLVRSDIRVDPGDGSVQPGVPLTLRLTVQHAEGDCSPVEGAVVDVWHCNAAGLYSDEAANGTVGEKYLRGTQTTGADGAVTFTTIYPGWYRGRAIHIHFKVRTFSGASATYEFTSQLFFDDALSDQVMAAAPYSARGARDTRNANDGIYGSTGASLIPAMSGTVASGLTATHTVGLAGLPASAGSGSQGSGSQGSGSSGGGGAGTETLASVVATRFTRSGLGRRVLTISFDLDEAVAVDARVLRNGALLARRRVARVAAGRRSIRVVVGRRVGGGTARLRLAFAGTGGRSRVVITTIRVPARS